MITITRVRAILTAPENINLIVVKVETSEPGLYGLGCATFAYRELAVKSVIEDYFDPLLRGRNVADIEELWQLMNNNSYWRNGPITNNAISGVDMALWDIKGKMANMPVYDLLGGKSREAAAVYMHAEGNTLEEVGDRVQSHIDNKLNHVRIQWGGYGSKPVNQNKPLGAKDGVYYAPDKYMDKTVELFEYMRNRFGYDVHFLHDVHERLSPIDGVNLAKRLEKYNLFFLEDVFSPEQSEWLKMLRNQTSTPIAIGELYNNPKEWDYLICNRLIDFIRIHVSQIGGITAARKLAIFGEHFGIRTAWHGPGDVSPVGHSANVQLSIVAKNFGIQEWTGFSDISQEMFPGCPILKDGYAYANTKPGLGIDINEELATKYPAITRVTEWTQSRITDGTLNTP